MTNKAGTIERLTLELSRTLESMVEASDSRLYH